MKHRAITCPYCRKSFDPEKVRALGSTIGARIMQLRKERGITQPELGFMLKRPRGYQFIHDIEYGSIIRWLGRLTHASR